MHSLSRFYSDPARVRSILPILQGQSPISLRLLDFFATSYSRVHNTSIRQRDGVLNVHLSYRAQLRAYSKAMFDPFRRRERILFYYTETEVIETTCAQLAFFRWLLEHGILEYITEHLDLIERDMVAVQREHQARKRAVVAVDRKSERVRRKRMPVCVERTRSALQTMAHVKAERTLVFA